MEKMNIKTIAKLANVDHSTVSRALRNSPVVKKSTRDRILKIAKEYDYVPNEIARSLKTQNTRIIGLLVSDIKNPFFTEIISATESYLARNKYNIILCNTNYSIPKERELLNLLFSRGVDGIIFSPTSMIHLHTKFFKRYSIPAVLLDIDCRNLETNSVFVDQEVGAYSAITFLLQKGHRRIAFLAGPQTMSSSEQAIVGFRKAHNDNNVMVDETLILRIPQNYDIAYSETLKLLKKSIGITAIFSLTDFMCIGVYRALQEQGLRIPQDIAVIGYDDLPFSRFMQPSLTTVRQPSREIGNNAAQIILDNIKAYSEWEPMTVKLKPELIVRDSV
jgi:LacI family transcriptional regulator